MSAYGYNCVVCGEPIVEPQPTEHTEEGLAHLICTVEMPPQRDMTAEERGALCSGGQ